MASFPPLQMNCCAAARPALAGMCCPLLIDKCVRKTGHQDFSEDTYRTLAAADNAVMLIDAAKGLEPQTRKLFEVAHLRRLPLFTFVNKLDRPSLSPFEVHAVASGFSHASG